MTFPLIYKMAPPSSGSIGNMYVGLSDREIKTLNPSPYFLRFHLGLTIASLFHMSGKWLVNQPFLPNSLQHRLLELPSAPSIFKRFSYINNWKVASLLTVTGIVHAFLFQREWNRFWTDKMQRLCAKKLDDQEKVFFMCQEGSVQAYYIFEKNSFSKRVSQTFIQGHNFIDPDLLFTR